MSGAGRDRIMWDAASEAYSFLVGYAAAIVAEAIGLLYSVIRMGDFPYLGEKSKVGLGGILLSMLFCMLVYATFENIARVSILARGGWSRPLVRSILVSLFMFGAYVASAAVMYSYNCGMEGLLLSCPSLIFIQLFMRVVSAVMVIGMAWLVYIVLRVKTPSMAPDGGE